MTRVLRTVVAAAAVLAVLTVVSPARAAGEGVVSGQVVNKTAGGSPIGTLEVSLLTYVNGKATATMQKTAVDDSGRFEFRGLATDPGTTYAATTWFQSANYTSAPVALTAASPTETTVLTVYDSTTSDEKIYVSTGHTIVYPVDGALEILEVWSLQNLGDKTLVSSPGAPGNTTLKFALPVSAVSPTPGDGISMQFVGRDGFLTAPVAPGTQDVNFTYFIPYAGSEVSIARTLDYPAAEYHLLVQDTGARVTSTVLTAGPKQTLSGTSFLDLAGRNLSRGAVLDASFTGMTAASSGAASAFPWQWLLIGVVLLALVVLIYPRLKRRTIEVSPNGDGAAGQLRPASYDEDTLVAELASLDEEFEAGSIAEIAYTAQRSRLKAVLADIYARRVLDPKTNRQT